MAPACATNAASLVSTFVSDCEPRGRGRRHAADPAPHVPGTSCMRPSASLPGARLPSFIQTGRGTRPFEARPTYLTRQGGNAGRGSAARDEVTDAHSHPN